MNLLCGVSQCVVADLKRALSRFSACFGYIVELSLDLVMIASVVVSMFGEVEYVPTCLDSPAIFDFPHLLSFAVDNIEGAPDTLSPSAAEAVSISSRSHVKPSSFPTLHIT